MFYGELLDKLKLENADLAFPRVTILGKVGVLVEGHRGLLYFNESEIRFRVKNGVMTVIGEDLKLFETGKSEAVVEGVIAQVSYA